MRLFVYGSLISGHHNNHRLDGARRLGATVVDGFQMIDLGGIPGVFHSHGDIQGEVYEINEDILFNLDRLEGYIESDHASSTYVREEIVLPKFGKCWIYVWNGNSNDGPQVAGGSWRTKRALMDLV